LGALFLNEKLSTKKVIGMAAIILGIVLFNI